MTHNLLSSTKLHPRFFELPHPSMYTLKSYLPQNSEREKVTLLHLPLAVDTIIIDSIAKGTALKVQSAYAQLRVAGYALWSQHTSIILRGHFDCFYFMSGHAAIEEKINHAEQVHEQRARREKRCNEGYGLWRKFT